MPLLPPVTTAILFFNKDIIVPFGLLILCETPGRYSVWTASELRPTAIYRKLGAGREDRVEREEDDGLGDFLRSPEALHGSHAGHLLPNLGGRVFIGKH